MTMVMLCLKLHAPQGLSKLSSDWTRDSFQSVQSVSRQTDTFKKNNMQSCHAVPDKGSSHTIWTHHFSRLDSFASHRPVSHYTGKYASESETGHKTQELSFQGNLAHEQNKPFLTQVIGQHPNDTEQKNAQHGTRNTHEPPSWMLSYVIPKSGNFQHTHQLNT